MQFDDLLWLLVVVGVGVGGGRLEPHLQQHFVIKILSHFYIFQRANVLTQVAPIKLRNTIVLKVWADPGHLFLFFLQSSKNLASISTLLMVNRCAWDLKPELHNTLCRSNQ